MKNGWIITEVNTEFLDADEIDTMGPRGMNDTKEDLLRHGTPFKMFDDDDIWYYSGYLIGDEMAPLDDFGAPNAGCTDIRVLRKGEWVLI